MGGAEGRKPRGDGGGLPQGTIQVGLHKVEETIALAAVEPDDGGQVLELLGGEIVDLARDLSVDVAGVDHEHLVAAVRGLATVEVPKLARDGAGIEEVGADGNHHVYIAGLDQLAADFGLGVAGATGLR